MQKIIRLLSSERPLAAIAVATFVLSIVIISFGYASYNDFFWHLALGKWMFATKSLLTHDIFSYTFTGKVWLNSTWLYDGLLYSIYTTSGYWGLNLFRAVIIALGYLFFIRTSRSEQKVPLLIVVSIFAFSFAFLRNFYRPEITQPLFIGYFLYALYNYKQRGSKLLYTIPAVEMAWVNIHGSFTLGIVLILIFLGSELLRTALSNRGTIISALKQNRQPRIYTGVLLATIVASFINPYGTKIYDRVFWILSQRESLSNIAEWRATPFVATFSFIPTASGILNFLFWLTVISIFLKIRADMGTTKNFTDFLSRLPYEDLALLGFGFLLLFRYARFIHIFSMIVGLIFVKYSVVWTQKLRSGSVIPILIFAAVFARNVSSFDEYKLINGPGIAEAPRETINFILDNKLTGPLFNEYADGGYWIWYLYPHNQIFIDGRSPNLFDGQFFWLFRNSIHDDIFKKIVEKHDLQLIVWPNSMQFPETLPATEWNQAFFDNYASIYVRKNERNKALNDAWSYQILNKNDKLDYKTLCSKKEEAEQLFKEINIGLRSLALPVEAVLALSRFAIECERDSLYRDADVLLSYLIRHVDASAPIRELRHNRGTIRMRLGRPQDALKDFRKSKSGSTDDPELLTSLGEAYFNLEKYADAKRAFEKALLSGDAVTIPIRLYQVYGWTLYHLDENEKAIDFQERYLLILNEEPMATDYLYLSRSYRDAQNTEMAESYFEKAKALDPSLAP